MPESAASYDSLFAKIYSEIPECGIIGLDAVADGSFLWRYLGESKPLRQFYLPYAFEGLRRYHTVPLPPTFEEYLAKFNAKKRYNLKRQVRILQDRSEGSLRLQCVESPGQVDKMLDVASALWPSHVPKFFSPVANRPDAQRRFTSLAARGLLRSYYLESASDPVACILGFQHGSVYVVDATMYNKALAPFSPGAVMQFLFLQDVISRRPVRLINFGFGDPESGYETTNVYFGAAPFLLFRNTFANRMRRSTHAVFRSTLATAKKVLRRVRHKREGADG
ncbi:MAG: GNAT family N-acetyltransferase [Gemmataceae bacterium]